MSRLGGLVALLFAVRLCFAIPLLLISACSVAEVRVLEQKDAGALDAGQPEPDAGVDAGGTSDAGAAPDAQRCLLPSAELYSPELPLNLGRVDEEAALRVFPLNGSFAVGLSVGGVPMLRTDEAPGDLRRIDSYFGLRGTRGIDGFADYRTGRIVAGRTLSGTVAVWNNGEVGSGEYVRRLPVQGVVADIAPAQGQIHILNSMEPQTASVLRVPEHGGQPVVTGAIGAAYPLAQLHLATNGTRVWEGSVQAPPGEKAALFVREIDVGAGALELGPGPSCGVRSYQLVPFGNRLMTVSECADETGANTVVELGLYGVEGVISGSSFTITGTSSPPSRAAWTGQGFVVAYWPKDERAPSLRFFRADGQATGAGVIHLAAPAELGHEAIGTALDVAVAPDLSVGILTRYGDPEPRAYFTRVDPCQ